MKQEPPKYALRFLRFFCKETFLEEIEGDLYELFEWRIETKGYQAARRWFAWDVLRSFRWINIKKINPNLMSISLMKNYLKVGSRNIIRDKAYTLLNVFGLSLGLSVFLVLILYIQHEFSFDTFHNKADQTFRVIQVFTDSHGENPRAGTSINLAKAVKEELPIVEEATNIVRGMPTWVQVGADRYFEENNALLASPEFFQVFDFEILEGDKINPLSEPYTMVLSEKQALKYFNRLDVVGESLNFERYGSFRITAVMKDVPRNSYLQFEMVFSQDFDQYFENVASWFPNWFQSWRGSPARTYVVLSDALQKEAFEEQLPALLRKYKGPDWRENPYYLQNIQDQHFYSGHLNGQWQRNIQGNLNQVKVFSIIAFLLLIIAGFNYINLTTARAAKRAKEVGVRKTVGARKGQLIAQFLSESVLVVSLALLISLGLTIFILPYFEQITQVKLSLDINAWKQAAIYILITLFSLSLLGGIYPAFYLSRFDPARILKSHQISVRTNALLRYGLVSFQFVLVLFMLVALLVVNDQMQFMSKQALGFDKDHLLVVEINGGGVRSNFSTIKNELLANPNIENITGMTRVISSSREPVSVDLHPPEDPNNPIATDFYGMDEDGIQTLGLNLLAGENFSGAYTKDSSAVFLNEAAAQLVGGTNIIGQWIQLGENFNAQVIGILENFHFRSLHERIGPLVIGHVYNPFESIDDIVIKVRSEELLSTVQYVESVHNKFDENGVMSKQFLDEMIQSFYDREVLFRRIFTGAALISLLIALLGVVGLAAYTANAKTKDFGVRKVFGATSFEILQLQWKNYWKPLGFALLIAGGISWYLLSNWLQNFAYRIDFTPRPILIAFILVSLVTMLTVMGVGYRIARESPVKSLRME